MEEVGAQVASPLFIHQALPSRFCEGSPMARKRDLPYQTSNFHHHQQQQQYQQQRFNSGFQNPIDNWNPKVWDWDSVRFVAKPLEAEILHLGTATAVQSEQKKREEGVLKKTPSGEDDESLRLKLGGSGSSSIEETVSRPNKRVRSGSPGGTNYPMCQVDNCREDLSNAKDYHRRHKVCEVHSKSTKALVGKQMQRFCQQCSRFHPLSEFDEGKRSCRRRLAGHNRRRRKTQPEDVTSRLLVPGNRDNASSGNLDIVNLLTVLARAQALASSEAKPGCREKCGNLSIPYPFGIGDPSCFKESGHELVCDESYDPPLLLLGPGSNITVLNISLQAGLMSVTLWVAYNCYNNLGLSSDQLNQQITLPNVYAFSDTENKFTALGCDTRAFMFNTDGETFHSGCVSFCGNTSNIEYGYCSGIGCCQTSIPRGLRELHVDLGSFYNHTKTWSVNPCSYAFLADQNWLKFSSSDLLNFSKNAGFSFQNKTSAPVVLDWVVGVEGCEEARKNSTSYSCGENSFCSNATNVPGYRCNCNKGYQGNPYLPNGCQDIDECRDPNTNPCEGVCHNTLGSFSCSCPPGTVDSGKKDGLGCIPSHKHLPILQLTIGIGLSLLFLLIACSWIYWVLQKRKLIKLKEKFFKQNGGLLLQQQLSMRELTVEATKIFTAEELEKATNNYDEGQVLGRGGYGTVYRGNLPDQRIVAIKKSKTIDENQIEQFINEVVILSQINHKNVVKLLGCCLETEVPLLVYEFITNGTLYHHIHHKGPDFSLSWEHRIRIAAETAGALAYLHSAASPPIIHRDIKSTNILLDNNHTAKVADFGASRLVPLDQTKLSTLVQGTMGYLDPEYFLTSQLTEKSDVYSFGVVLVELLTGKKAVSFERPQEERNLAMYFVTSMKENQLLKILENRIVQEVNADRLHKVAELATRCLKMNRDERPSMKEVAMELEGIRRF